MSGPVSVSEPAPITSASQAAGAGLARSLVRRASVGISSAFAAILGLAPHILHHAGPLAGAALFAGVAGSLVFGALGFVLAIPFLLRMRRRFGSWRAPLAMLAVFATVFSISTFVVGPAITGAGDDGASSPAQQQRPAQPATEDGHEAHH